MSNGYQLVGVADEGRAYINEGAKDDVFTLKEGFVYGTFPRALATVLLMITTISSLCARAT